MNRAAERALGRRPMPGPRLASGQRVIVEGHIVLIMSTSYRQSYEGGHWVELHGAVVGRVS